MLGFSVLAWLLLFHSGGMLESLWKFPIVSCGFARMRQTSSNDGDETKLSARSHDPPPLTVKAIKNLASGDRYAARGLSLVSRPFRELLTGWS